MAKENKSGNGYCRTRSEYLKLIKDMRISQEVVEDGKCLAVKYCDLALAQLCNGIVNIYFRDMMHTILFKPTTPFAIPTSRLPDRKIT
jgi:hypothetical protein